MYCVSTIMYRISTNKAYSYQENLFWDEGTISLVGFISTVILGTDLIKEIYFISNFPGIVEVRAL